MTEAQKNELVEQYTPLINKLTKQFFDSNQGLCSWSDLYSMALEGFALAISKYDSERSSMTFTQYAAYAIRNNILTCLNEETRTVKLSAYAQKVVIANGGTLFNTVSIDQPITNDEDTKPRDMVMGMYEEEKFSNGDVFKYLYSRLEDQFNQRDRDMFYKIFGLHGFDETPNKDIAKEYGVSEGLVSQRVKKVINWIKQDRDLCEMLSSIIS